VLAFEGVPERGLGSLSTRFEASAEAAGTKEAGEREEERQHAHSKGDDYAELRAELARAVRTLCPRWLSSRAEDLVQVALLRILELRQRSEQDREFSSFYLKRVAYSALVDEIRRLERRRESPLENDEGEPISLPSTTPGPERHQASRELGAAIRDCLRGLHQQRQLAVTLYLQEVSVADAAGLLGWDLKQTRNRVYRGVADLRACLEGKGLTP
jgi:RNA polymerase sigma-70 factor (ECF subfamily)